jgi:hypothetical protein
LVPQQYWLPFQLGPFPIIIRYEQHQNELQRLFITPFST